MKFDPTDDRAVMIMLKGREKYIFIWERGREPDLLEVAGRFAADSSLSFTADDCDVVHLRSALP